MNDHKTVKGTRKLTTANTPANAISFLVNQAIHETVNTAEVVSIKAADQQGVGGPAGYASAAPLVCQVDAFNKALPPATIPKMPYFRPQAGKAAIIMDPQPGDKAVAVFMKRDSSGVASGRDLPVQPASFRSYDQADGYLINGFLGETPEIWLLLDPVTGRIELSTKEADIEITCRDSGDILVKGRHITLEGDVRISGNLIVDGTIKSQDITLNSHTHPGDSGGVTGQPNRGT